MSKVQDYLALDLRRLRKLCIDKGLPGITRKSDRQQCLNAIMDTTTTNNKLLNRRRSLPKGTASRDRKDSTSHSYSPFRNRTQSEKPKRSRKRSRHHLDEENHGNHDNEALDAQKRKKRRKIKHHGSTITTPERQRQRERDINKNNNINKSPLRNPRIFGSIQQSQAPQPPQPPPMNYQAPDFLNLLDQDSSDGDIDIFNQNNNKNTTNVPIKQKKVKKTKSPLKTIKASSPEDNEFDDDNNSDLEDNNNNDIESSEIDTSSSSESNESDEELSIIPPQRQTNHRQTQSHRYQDDMKSVSRSRSGSNLKNRNNTTNRIRSKSKPQYALNTNNNNNNNIRYHKPSQHPRSMPQTVTMSPTSPIQPFSISHPPPHIKKKIHQKTISHPPPMLPAITNISDDIKNDNNHNDKSKEPITFQSRIKEYYLYIIDILKTIWFIIIYIPSKIMEMIRFLFKHSFIIIIVIIIIFLLYSPTKKMIKSIDFQTATERVLKHLHIIPRIKYCDSNINISDDNECTSCPKQAICANGNFLYCTGDKQLIDGECKYDKKEIDKLQKQMEIYSISLLSSRCGQYECQKYWLYNKLYSINKENDNIIFDAALNEEELSTKLAVKFELDSTSHLFNQVFEKFTKSIKESNKTIRLKPLQYDRDIGYFSNKSSKSLICHLIMFLSDNFVLITTLMFCGLSVSLFWWIRQRKRRERLEKKQREQDRKENILCVLRTYLNETNQRWIPIDQIRAQTMEEVSDKEWKKVENLVDADANVQKSLQMMDGLARLCWKLSDTALIH